MTACPHCGGTGELPCGDLEGKVEELRAACIVAGIVVSAMGNITEGDAAKLLERTSEALANWRYDRQPIRFSKLNGRVRYALTDLAAWMLANQI